MTDTVASQVSAIVPAFAHADLDRRAAELVAAAKGRIVLTTSFGLEDQVLADIFAPHAGRVDFVTLDTGRLFPEVYTLWSETERRYGLIIRPFYPRHDAIEALVGRDGINGFYASRDARKACCEARKVEPLKRALAGASLWISGLRADQSDQRSAARFAEWNEPFGVVKVNPLLDRNRDDLVALAAARGVPINPLHAQGYLSIGCAPCTRAVAPGESERSGRWWWEDDGTKECGLHVAPDGRLVRSREGTDLGR